MPSPSRGTSGASSPVRALDRGLALLVELGRGGERPLRDLAIAVGLSPSTTHRLLEALIARGFARQAGRHGPYALGVRALEVGSAYVSGGVTEASHEAMAAVMTEFNETVNLAVRDCAHAVYVHQVEGQQRVRMFTRIGARVPLHVSGVGKALLAWDPTTAPEDLADENGHLKAYTASTLVTPATLRRELGATARRGYAIDREEYEPGVRCAAAPVRDASGEVVAAISVSAPVFRLDDSRLAEVGGRLVEAATRISLRLGWRPG